MNIKPTLPNLSALLQRSPKLGLPPGTLVYVGEHPVDKPVMTIIEYDDEHHERVDVKELEEIERYRVSKTITWLNVDGLRDAEFVAKIGAEFGLHPLVMEDVLNTSQRPKFEDYPDHLFLVLRMFYYENGTGEVTSEQVSIIIGEDYVLSFQETVGDVLDPIRDRLANKKGRVRTHGPDYLAYAIMDVIVDHYFAIMEQLGEQLESLEDELIENPTRQTLARIYRHKRGVLDLRRAIWPLRDAVNAMLRCDSKLLTPDTRVYLRDAYDHVSRVIDTIEVYRETVATMLEIYLSAMSQKMNEVMKVLTIIATIFIPLTFLAGVYGMNFEYMPELEWPWAYFGVLGVMLAVALGMVYYFRRKEWF